MRILIGDSQAKIQHRLDTWHRDADIDLATTPAAIVELAKTGDYDLVVVNLAFSKCGCEGMQVLEKLRRLECPRFLWTERVNTPGVNHAAKQLGATVLGRYELATITGLMETKKPLSEGSDVFVFLPVPHSKIEDMLQKIAEFHKDIVAIDVGDDAWRALATNRYGLVVDLSPIYALRSALDDPGEILANLPLMPITSVPRLACLWRRYGIVSDLLDIIRSFLGHHSQTEYIEA